VSHIIPATAAGMPRRIATRGLYEAMTLTARFPWIALPVARWRGHGVPLSADTDIVIEGFPRSGNAFAVGAFAMAQDRAVRVAHHVHAPGHVIAAARRGVPCLILVREPDDAAVDVVRIKPALTPGQAVRGYVRFYRPLLPHRDRVVVATFEEATSDLGAVIRRINERFGTSFGEFEHTEENMAKVEAATETLWEDRTGPGLPLVGRGRPAAAEVDEESVRARLREPQLQGLRRKAFSLYRRLAG
jgi:hypothetical protein